MGFFPPPKHLLNLVVKSNVGIETTMKLAFLLTEHFNYSELGIHLKSIFISM